MEANGTALRALYDALGFQIKFCGSLSNTCSSICSGFAPGTAFGTTARLTRFIARQPRGRQEQVFEIGAQMCDGGSRDSRVLRRLGE